MKRIAMLLLVLLFAVPAIAAEYFPPPGNNKGTIGGRNGEAWAQGIFKDISVSGSITGNAVAGVTTDVVDNTIDAAGAVWGSTNAVVFEGTTADAYETSVVATDPTADRTVTLPNASGAVLLVPDVPQAAYSMFTGNNTFYFEGTTVDAHETALTVTDPTADVIYQFPTGAAGTYYPVVSTLATNFPDIANSVTGASNGWVFEGATADAHETTISPVDATADRTLTLPDATGTVALTAGLGSRLTVTAGSGTTTVTTAHCGGVLTAAADADGVFNLPATSAGCVLRFVNIGAAANNLLTINPDNADQIFGTVTLAASVVAIAGSAGDAVSNTKGTSIRGDSMTILGDGVDGWYILSSTGIWADIN